MLSYFKLSPQEVSIALSMYEYIMLQNKHLKKSSLTELLRAESSECLFIDQLCIDGLCSPPWELELRPLGVATGNALSVTCV